MRISSVLDLLHKDAFAVGGLAQFDVMAGNLHASFVQGLSASQQLLRHVGDLPVQISDCGLRLLASRSAWW